MMSDHEGHAEADEVRIVNVDDGDVTEVNALLDEGWRLLACGVAEHRDITYQGAVHSTARCAFILGRRRGEHVLDEAAAVVEAVTASEDLVVTVPLPGELLEAPRSN